MGTVSINQFLEGWFDLRQGIRALQPGASTISLRALIQPLLQPAPMDLVSVAVDDNGLLRDAKWGFQVAHPGELPDPRAICPNGFDDPQCTTQSPTKDDPSGINDIVCSDGHVNWMPCTYEGPVFWDSKSTAGTDDDYNINLVTPGGAGQTSANTGTLLLEFDSDETIDHFSTTWWKSFHSAVDASKSAAKTMLDGRFAIVTGLIGLDAEHSCHAESHPVWAMAIRVNDDPNDETWAMFVRNWGDEGFCSSHQHYLDLPNNTYIFRLPWRSGAISVNTTATNFATNHQQVTGPGVTVLLHQGVLVAFTLPSPEQGAVVSGELHLQWSGAALHLLPQTAAIMVTAKSTDPNSSHAKLESLIENLTPEQREIFNNSFSQIPAPNNFVPASFAASAAGPSTAQVRSVPNPQQDQKGEQLVQALHAVFGTTIPDVGVDL